MSVQVSHLFLVHTTITRKRLFCAVSMTTSWILCTPRVSRKLLCMRFFIEGCLSWTQS
ncbi:hypothetical protein MAR_022130 [Mya arenaria]|uniref:Uncharacterized protein n=1 Tax=Mya arenaria TaxID=6604 RepID=A0ABY7DM02_MYAAR|nr:hypothetical protein MAR_022130 [Mya arenaria]